MLNPRMKGWASYELARRGLEELKQQADPEPPDKEWAVENDRSRIARMLNDSSKTVRDAVKSRIETRREMELHYDHPILLLEHMIWHEGYHHGQIKLALKIAGRPASDDDVGHVTWGVWMKKKLS